MYAGCNGATCVYACCLTIRACICGKYDFLALEGTTREFKST
jgi:hypothetical protein